MYIKVYIFGMEMSQRIHFWFQLFSKTDDFLRKWQKITFLVKYKKILDSLLNTISSEKCWNCLKIMLRQSLGGVSHFFWFGLFFFFFWKFWPKSAKKVHFCQEVTFMAHFGLNFKKLLKFTHIVKHLKISCQG